MNTVVHESNPLVDFEIAADQPESLRCASMLNLSEADAWLFLPSCFLCAWVCRCTLRVIWRTPLTALLLGHEPEDTNPTLDDG